MTKDDFQIADRDAGVVVEPSVTTDGGRTSVVPHKSTLPSNVSDYRRKLVAQYHSGAPSLIEKLKRAGKEDQESLLIAMIDEVITETDNLLGNQLIATENGELRDATIISFKRSEVLEKAIKAVQAKKEFELESGVNVDSAAMLTVIRYFMSKSADAFDRAGLGGEVKDLFFRTLGSIMDDWKKELKEKFEEQGPQR